MTQHVGGGVDFFEKIPMFTAFVATSPTPTRGYDGGVKLLGEFVVIVEQLHHLLTGRYALGVSAVFDFISHCPFPSLTRPTAGSVGVRVS